MTFKLGLEVLVSRSQINGKGGGGAIKYVQRNILVSDRIKKS